MTTMWGSPVEVETRRRILLAVWAYAYEIENVALVSDAVFDEWAFAVDLNISTKRPDLDDWFRKNFTPHTGQWIHNHPEFEKVEARYKWIMSIQGADPT